MTAGMYGWITESTPAATTLAPAQALTVAQTLPNAQFPPWNSPSVAYQPTTAVAGSMMQPYMFPCPPTAAPTPPSGVAPGARGPQPLAGGPTGPYGPGIGGMGKPMVVTASLPGATHGVAYSTKLSASGGVGTITYTATPLPTGITLSGNTLSGTPTTAGTTNVVVTATDANGNASPATTLPLVVA